MPKLINLNAETGANIIDDDAEPTLTITNSGSGAGFQTNKLVASSSATIAVLNVSPGILAANATQGIGIQIPTPSVASGAVLKLSGQAYVSAVSLIFAAGAGWAGMGAIRVVRPDGTFGWLPVLPDAQVTAAAVGA